MLLRILLATRYDELAERITRLLASPEAVIERVALTRRQAWNDLAKKSADVVFISRSALPADDARALEIVTGLPEAPSVVLLTDTEEAADRMRFAAAGVDSVLDSRAPDDTLLAAMTATLERRRQIVNATAGPAGAGQASLDDFASSSPAMASFVETVRKVAPSNTSVLILGETGSGKEHLARVLHGESARRGGPFVAVNCGAIPEGLLESELFGHVEGAFTGAGRSRRGQFELAHGGTLFLDEIGELAPHLQVKLLRVLQFKRIRRVGAERDLAIDTRVLAATHRRVTDEVAAGHFRADLYYRLSVITLTIPPLRERREDIPQLITRLAAEVAHQLGRRSVEVTPRALDAMVAHDWPGNVRELANVLERGALLGQADTIDLSDLPEALAGGGGPSPQPPAPPAPLAPAPAALTTLPLREARDQIIAEFERAYLEALLAETHGRVGDAAERAGIDPRSLYNKMKRYGLQKESFRSGPTEPE